MNRFVETVINQPDNQWDEAPPLLPNLKFGDLEPLRVLGQGSFGKVYLVVNNNYENSKFILDTAGEFYNVHPTITHNPFCPVCRNTRADPFCPQGENHLQFNMRLSLKLCRRSFHVTLSLRTAGKRRLTTNS